jgi:hypothetical protein
VQVVQVVMVEEELLVVQMFLCEEVSEFGLAERLCHRYGSLEKI